VEASVADPFDKLTRGFALKLSIFLIPAYFVFDHFWGPGKARAAAICSFVVITAVWLRWDLRTRFWFWCLVTLLVLLQVPVVLFNPWGDKNYPGVVLMPLGLLDLAIAYGSIKLAEKIAVKAFGASEPRQIVDDGIE
jgi:hypothetical protein